MTTIRLQVAPRIGPANPRGAVAGAAVALALGRLAAALFRRSTATPPLPSDEAAAAEARLVRELAGRYRDLDPRYAADLVAAADRHERQHGVI